MKAFIVIFRFKKPGDKAAGPVQQYRIYARDLREAWDLARQQGGYPGIELLNVVEA
ncbi:MAG: hypothetical protein HUU22_02870 [Phycisphaerae bacterium]|nr:hypothetical protein [Phycisphaerae bacterium]NUQ44957.1 hypothetical protein [Phycisphaerae bacterium]